MTSCPQWEWRKPSPPMISMFERLPTDLQDEMERIAREAAEKRRQEERSDQERERTPPPSIDPDDWRIEQL
jgi:hypothetical protein